MVAYRKLDMDTTLVVVYSGNSRYQTAYGVLHTELTSYRIRTLKYYIDSNNWEKLL